ncbi:MAG: hypothetical protein FH749_15770 [Firmicutes bacterium]|nr:hypothetical protein [Bacillota bacterium]
MADILPDGSILYDRYFHRLTPNHAFTGSASAPGYADAIPHYDELPASMRWRQPMYLLQQPDGSVGYIEPPAEKYMLTVSPQGDFAWMTEDRVYIGRLEPIN